ncbi:glycoside hydrolase family 5 protein [Chroogloeocystis siderophila]|jgi:endoglucanase|uniref:Endoglucanase n=1 Tax=Chroogloeocystis siderophila 5.2 s.c.1 TaxID=247279 RepID=A0A1U7HC62_9CHRO|nr:cellulase family glycosylhydrolase [Chroogloeocystis siderophila]OKH21128.1 endoglucanase [Chroogloeocystis siderophila 5.2 s.c.1]
MKKLKKYLALFLLSYLFIIGTIFIWFDTKSSAVSSNWLHVDGIHIKDIHNNKVVLRGVSLPDLAHYDFRGKIGKSPVELIDLLTDHKQGWYSTVVRLPVYPIWKLGYNSNPKRYYDNYIKPAVDKCVERKIYCIIDWHYIDDPTNLDAETRTFWADIAPKYKNYPNVLFEVFNENSTDMSWATWKNIVQPWIDLIRSYAPNNLILVGAPHYAQHLYDAPSNPIKGKNIVYVGHIYPGLDQKLWDKWIFDVADKIPLFITEWGFRNGADYPTSGTVTSFGIPLKKKLEKYNLSWTCWVADHSWQPEMFDKDWNLLVGENYMGGFVQDYLLSKN